jgi:hypothetical protein
VTSVEHSEHGERGGVLVRVREGEGGGALGFVPAEIARRLIELSSFTEVPGARPPVTGIALVDGAVVTVMQIGSALAKGSTRASHAPSYEPGEDWGVPGADRAILCDLGGVEVALTGATVVATGVFDGTTGGEGVHWRSDVVPILDVRALYALAEAANWSPRALDGSGELASQSPSSQGASGGFPPTVARGAGV